MKSALALAGMALAMHGGTVFAQPVATASTSPVVVTATRTARTADESLASVTVITREDIERRQSQDIVDLLRTQAGIDLTRSGGPGGQIALFMRGANSNHVLVLIDGVRVPSVPTGTFEWRSLPIAHIERIEIVRGPRASLYGSDAIGGVIQIFTRRPRGIDTAIGTGSFDTHRADLALGSSGRIRGFVTGSHFQTDGFSAQNERGSSFDPDDDGIRHQDVSAGFEGDISNATRFLLIGRQSRGRTEFDIGESDIDNESVSARVSHTTTPTWSQNLSLGLFREGLLTRSAFPSDIRSTRRTADWQNDVVLSAVSFLTAGLAYSQESGANIDPSINATLFDREQDSRAAFALWQQRFGTKDLQLAGRYDDYSSFGGHGTWSTAYGWQTGTDARAWVSYGTAFRAPSLNDLYHPGFSGGFFAGNPDLEPERSRTAELGLRQRLSAAEQVAVSVFSTRVDNLIAFEGPNSQAVNVAKASARGMEIEHSYRAEPWYLSTAVTVQRARNEITDSPLVRRADMKLSTFVEYRFGRAAIGAEFIGSSERRDINGDIAGYGIVNFAARYAVNGSLSLEGRLENTLDKKYQIIDGFNTTRRALFVTLRYRAPNGVLETGQ